MFQPKPSYSYDDLGLHPIYKSNIESRGDVDTSTNFLGYNLSLPIVTAPMATVSGDTIADAMYSLGGLTFFPRTDSLNKDISLWNNHANTIPAIPATNDFERRVNAFYNVGCRCVCIDVANGFHIAVERAVQYIKKNMPDMKIITGNVASVSGFAFLANLGVDAVRVGISNGSVCSTALATKVGVGQASLIREIAEWSTKIHKTLIIADGGIKNPGDVALAIALGADVVMSGGIFAGTEESPGQTTNINGQMYKHHAGQASKSIKGNDKFVEGADVLVSYKGPVANVWQVYMDGLKSSMAYMNAKNIEELKYLEDEAFVFLHQGARYERTVYAK